MNSQTNWLEKFFQVFSDSVKCVNIESPINEIFAYKQKVIEDTYEIHISPWIYEFYGGKKDGSWLTPKYEIDLTKITYEFDKIQCIKFNSSKLQIKIEGIIGNNPVKIILNKKPAGTNPRRKINTFTNQITKIKY